MKTQKQFSAMGVSGVSSVYQVGDTEVLVITFDGSSKVHFATRSSATDTWSPPILPIRKEKF